MSSEVEVTGAVPPVSRSVPNEETRNLPQPTRNSDPVTPAAYAATPNTRAGVPNRTPRPPQPTRPPVPRNPGPTPGPRNPGPGRGVPRPTTSGAPPLNYKRERVSVLRRFCVPVTTTVLVLGSLVIIAILIKVCLDNYYYFCVKSFKFIPLDKWCDGIEDCAGGEDENRCVQRSTVTTTSIVRFSQQASTLLLYVRSMSTWSWVCSDNWDSTRARAVCAQIGFSSEPKYTYVPFTDLVNPSTSMFSDVQVQSNNDIQVLPISGGNCPSGMIVSLRCTACGSSNKQQRIVGGVDAPIENWPWQASLQAKGQHKCGGSLLNPYWILTAAHCFENQKQLDMWRVQCGMSKPTFLFGLLVDKIFVHSQYTDNKYQNDIALIKLKNAVQFSASVQPICLPGFDHNVPPSSVLWVTGWGSTQEGGSTSSVLQEVSIRLISFDVCVRNDPGETLDTMLCAGTEAGGRDACKGDSGGPLVYTSNSHWEQIGIVSWGNGCGRPGQPGVYTRVSSFLDWIHGTMKRES